MRLKNRGPGFLNFGVGGLCCGRLVFVFLAAFTAAAGAQSSPTYRGVFTNHVVTVVWSGLCDRPGLFQTNSYDQSSLSIPFSRIAPGCTNRSLQGTLQLNFPTLTPDGTITSPDTVRTITFTPPLPRSASFDGQWQLRSEVAGNTLQIFDTLSLGDPPIICPDVTQNYGTGLASGNYPVMLTVSCSKTNITFPATNGPDLVYQFNTLLSATLFAPSNPPQSRVLFLLSVDVRTYYRVRTAAWIWANTNKLRFDVGGTNLAPRTIQVTNTGTSNLIFSVSTVVSNGGNWLSVLPNQVTLTPNQRTNLTVSVDRTQLSDDLTNTASILIAGNSANSPQRISVEAVGTNFVRLIGLEVNQVVQDWSNSVPLIAGKTTTVRAHLQSTGAQPARATAKLRGFRNGVEILPRLDPSNPGQFIIPPTNKLDNRAMLRAMPNSSLNYLLPPNWTTGTVTLQLETNGIVCGEVAGTPNDCAATVAFLPAVMPRIKFIDIMWVGTNGMTNSISAADLNDLKPRLVSCYPIADLDAVPGASLWAGTVPPKVHDVRDYVKRLHDQDLRTMPDVTNRNYYGAITGDSLDGVAFISGLDSAGYLKPQRFAEGRHTHSHEIGHNLGRQHSTDASVFGTRNTTNGANVEILARGACGEVSDTNAPPYPYLEMVGGRLRPALGPMTLGPNALIYGYDHDADMIVSPDQYFDMMSYCSDVPLDFWPSKYTYEALIPAISNRFGNPASPPPPLPGDFIEFLARIDPMTDAVTFSPFVTTPGNWPPPAPRPGPYSLRLLNAAAQVIQQIPFMPDIGEPRGDVPRTLSFSIGVAANPAIRGVQVLRGAQVIGTRTASANAPTVRVTSPNGGENFGGDSITVTWTGADADGDVLSYMLQYSPDNGSTWETLAADLTSPSYSIPRRFIKGTGAGRVRIVASDGFLSGMDASDGTFNVGNNSPEIFVRSPGPGRVLLGNDQIVLDALAYDREDGALNRTNVTWRSDLDGVIGTGSRIYTNASRLREGVHVLTATATDFSNAVGTAQVSITVLRTNVANIADLAVRQASERTDIGLILTTTVENFGQANATSVRVSNHLPAGAAVLSAISSMGTCIVTNRLLSCNIPLLPANQALTITVQLGIATSGIYTNVVEARSLELDPNAANNLSQLAVEIVTQAPLLAIDRSENQVTISWPATTPTNFVLQSSVSLLPPAWSDVGSTPTAVNGRFQVNQNTAGTTRYYRLLQR